MHTSAPTFMEFVGTLLHAAQARAMVLDATGHTVPVLCMDIALDNAVHTPLSVKQYFPAGAFDQARAAAHRFKPGQRVTVQVPLVTLQMGGVAAHIHTHPTTTEAASPCPQ